MLGLALLLCLACCGGCSAFEVYLRRLEIHQTHEQPLIDAKPEVYLSCLDDGRDKVELPGVTEVNKPYAFDAGHRPVTFVERGQCRECRLKEADPLSPDDYFGNINVCEADFRETGLRNYTVPDQYDAQLQCIQCIRKPQPQETPSPPSPSPKSLPRKAAKQHEPVASAKPPKSGPPANAKNVSEDGRSASEAGLKASDNGPWESVSELTEDSEFELDDSGVRSWVPIALAVVLAAMSVGLLCGAVMYRLYSKTREQMEEERMAEFEAILGDPGVDFEGFVEEDSRAFEGKLGAFRFWGWRPRLWNRGQEIEHIPVSKI